jgi:putative transposase
VDYRAAGLVVPCAGDQIDRQTAGRDRQGPVGALRAAVRETRRRFPFRIDAMVVLPDHLHAVWTLPEGDCDFPVRRRLSKIRFLQSIPKGECVSPSWHAEARHLAAAVLGAPDQRRARLCPPIDSCWFNPVKHGLVTNVED